MGGSRRFGSIFYDMAPGMQNQPSSRREIVAYYRVSTQAQGIFGLGMESQRRSVEAYAQENHCTIVASYSEVETGRKRTMRNRPELIRAVAHARRSGAILAIARLDRLARNVFVTAQLLETGVEFVACDNPHANRLTIQILAAMAEHEGKLISERCRASAAVSKARGTVFGRKGRYVSPEDAKRWSVAAGASRTAALLEIYADLVPTILHMRYSAQSMRAIAERLNGLGHLSHVKRPLTGDVVRHILIRAGYGDVTRRIPGLTDFTPEQRAKSRISLAKSRLERDSAAYATVEPIVRKMRAEEEPYSRIVRMLNALGHRTPWGRLFSYGSLVRLLDRCGFDESPAVRRRLAPTVRSRATTAAAAKIREENRAFLKFIKRLREMGTFYKEIARRANSKGFRTQRNTKWVAESVFSYLKREGLRNQ